MPFACHVAVKRSDTERSQADMNGTGPDIFGRRLRGQDCASPAADRLCANASTIARSWPGRTPAYTRRVIATSLWPSRRDTRWAGKPWRRSIVAWACLRAWKLTRPICVRCVRRLSYTAHQQPSEVPARSSRGLLLCLGKGCADCGSLVRLRAERVPVLEWKVHFGSSPATCGALRGRTEQGGGRGVLPGFVRPGRHGKQWRAQ